MMRCVVLASVLGLTALGGGAEAGLVLSPVAVPVNTGGQFSSEYDIGNTIDQSGLSVGFTSGVTDFDTYLATGPLHNYLAFDREWFAPAGTTSAIIIYDLGGLYRIHRLALWNEEAGGIATMTVSTSSDLAFTNSMLVGTFEPSNNPLNMDYPAEVFDLIDSTARYVRLDLSGPQGGYIFPALSMGEIAFDVTSADVAAVPEPSTLISGVMAALLGLGYTWRRRKGVTAD